MYKHKIVYIKTFKIAPTFFDISLTVHINIFIIILNNLMH